MVIRLWAAFAGDCHSGTVGSVRSERQSGRSGGQAATQAVQPASKSPPKGRRGQSCNRAFRRSLSGDTADHLSPVSFRNSPPPPTHRLPAPERRDSLQVPEPTRKYQKSCSWQSLCPDRHPEAIRNKKSPLRRSHPQRRRTRTRSFRPGSEVRMRLILPGPGGRRSDPDTGPGERGLVRDGEIR